MTILIQLKDKKTISFSDLSEMLKILHIVGETVDKVSVYGVIRDRVIHLDCSYSDHKRGEPE